MKLFRPGLALISGFDSISERPSPFRKPAANRSAMAASAQSHPGEDDENRRGGDEITILGFGSLLSPRSARLTFPTLRNFRLGRVPNHRRVFTHPASIFFRRGIADLQTLEMSSLSCELAEGHSFVCSVFEVPNEGLSADALPPGGDGDAGGWIPSRAFLEREEEFEIAMVPYDEVNSTHDGAYEATILSVDSSGRATPKKEGVICRRSTDEAYLARWGSAHWEKQYLKYGVKTIWNWGRDSGLRPCRTYLRHCVLASWNCGDGGIGRDVWSADRDSGGICYDSFLDETFLVDRATTVRDYLRQHPEVMATEPPESLKERYGG